MENFIIRLYDAVPAFDHHSVHLICILERTIAVLDDVRVTKMSVTYDIKHLIALSGQNCVVLFLDHFTDAYGSESEIVFQRFFIIWPLA